MGRRRRQGNSEKHNNSIEDLLGNEENEYPIPDPNRKIISITSKLSDVHQKSLKEEIIDKFIEKFMEKLLNTVNHILV
jgi:hypothetical protein